MKIKKGDEILVTGGKDRGRKGKIERVFTKDNSVLITGINMYKRHMKARDAQNPGGIIDAPRPLPIARVAMLCPKCKKQTRVAYEEKGKEKHRICAKCRQLL